MAKYRRKSAFVEAYQCGANGGGYVGTRYGELLVLANEWLVTESDGRYQLVPDDEFRADYVSTGDPQQQTCKACGYADKFCFHVPDDVWMAVVPSHLRDRVVCLSCFDDFAAARGIDYESAVKKIYFAGKAAAFTFFAGPDDDE